MIDRPLFPINGSQSAVWGWSGEGLQPRVRNSCFRLFLRASGVRENVYRLIFWSQGFTLKLLSTPPKKWNEIREKYTIRWYKSTAEHATVLKMTMQRMLSRCDVRQSRAEADGNVFRFAGICWWTKVLRRNYRCDLMMVQDANTCILWPICARDIFFRKCDLFGLLTVLETKKSGAYQSQYGSSSEDREYLYKV